MNVAIVGTMGVPAKYGGFESLVENLIGDNCPEDVKYTIFCSGKDYKEHLKEYKGARLKYINVFHANGVQSILYDVMSLLQCFKSYDTILILGVSGCAFLPIFRIFSKKRLIINIDGLEHRRDKWNSIAKWFLRFSERQAVRFANVVVVDNKGIQDYVAETYNKDSVLIAYGGDHVLRELQEQKQLEILNKYGIERYSYGFCVCRIEPENNVHLILEAFANKEHPLVFVGNWDRSEYGKCLKEKYKAVECMKLLDSEYDLDVLYALRNNCRCYVHGHSAGGTNPSLVEAMFFGRPILAFDVVYNRETTKNKAYYFKNVDDLVSLIDIQHLEGGCMRTIAEECYVWSKITKQYVNLFGE